MGISASFYREYKIRMSSPRIFVENIANPLFILLIFGITLGNAVGEITSPTNEPIAYLNYFVIGAINISLISNAMVAATKMFIDKYVGLYEEMLSYPVKRSHILLGKLLFNLILSLIQAVVMIVFVSIISPSVDLDFKKVLLLLVLLVLGSSTWFFCMVLLAIKLKTQDAFNTVYFLIMTPIIFTSSIYYPIEEMPKFLQFLGRINPLSWLTDIGRLVYLEISTQNLFLQVFGLILLLLFTYIASIRVFSKGIS